ncbi:PREDICTED: mas-related G-protein coupled receptor member X2-like [Ceratotherium simum simum]|uniref:Mas-related G-protein coupled receptor member X2-like n=1 Tax=Ceratotherium simum simum TaxID=73337 RepID=A0ABM0H3C4_CERSS|nr:PREDICTED: mas-related G-protein coupled receptor member X2-like [Ceratotherium simum simum]
MDPTVTAWGTEYTAVNGSGQALPQTCSMETVVQASLTFIIALVGLAGNGIVLWILGFHMRRNAFTVYILNLAGADFLCLSLLIIRSLVLLSNFFRSSSISIPKFLTPVFTFVYIVGLSVLSAISTERCLSVLCPIWYRCRRPRHTSAVMCALLWALSLLLSVLRGEYCGFLFSDGDVGWCRVIDFISAAWLIFLFVLLSGSSLALPTRLLWGSQQVQLTRLYLTIVLTALVFLFCGLPLGIHWFLVFWIQGGFDMFSLHLYLVTMFLSCVNSSTNPVIYFFVGSFRRRQRQRQRRQTLKLVLQRALQDTPEVAESGGSLPQEPLEMSGSSVVS